MLHTSKMKVPRSLQRWAVEHAKLETGELVAVHKGWELRAQPPSRRWRGFVLVAPYDEVLKRKYWGEWNGRRLPDSQDMRLLSEHHPPVYEWLVLTCMTLWPEPATPYTAYLY
jgi:hypothetical protein